MAFELILLTLSLLAMLSIVVTALRVGISPMPSSSRARQVMMSMIDPHFTGTIFEPGAGWGGLAMALARSFPQARIEAFELSLVPWAFFKVRLAVSGLRNVSVHRQNFLHADFARANLVTAYLFTGGMQQLEPLLKNALPVGGVVISHTFSFREWKPDETRTVDDLYRSPIYRYVKR